MFIPYHVANCPHTDAPCGGCIDEARYAEFTIMMSELGITEEREIEQMWDDACDEFWNNYYKEAP